MEKFPRIELANISICKKGSKKVSLFYMGIYDLLKNELGYRYVKIKDKGHFIKKIENGYKEVNIIQLSHDFYNYVKSNYESFDIAKEVDKVTFLNMCYSKNLIKNNNYIRTYLSEDFNETDFNIVNLSTSIKKVNDINWEQKYNEQAQKFEDLKTTHEDLLSKVGAIRTIIN